MRHPDLAVGRGALNLAEDVRTEVAVVAIIRGIKVEGVLRATRSPMRLYMDGVHVAVQVQQDIAITRHVSILRIEKRR